MAKFTGVSDEELITQIVDYGNDYPKGAAKALGKVSYAELKSGSIRFKKKGISTVPLSSYPRALEIAQILKGWVENGAFLLTEPSEMIPTVPRK
jgi:uncharacterized protein (DUF39 family)